jgi:hypothetical protein
VHGGISLGGVGELTMAMLDECLFELDGIADFNAVYRRGTSDVLELEITAVNANGTDAARLQAAVRSALENNAHLFAAISAKTLQLSVSVSPNGYLPRRAGKRTLVEGAPG